MARTNAGIYWTQDSTAATAKILMHEWWSTVLLKKGITEEEILANPAAMPTIRRQPYNNMFVDYVNHMLPEFQQYYREHSLGHQFGYARCLTDRTTHSIRKGEMRRFREGKEWQPLHRMILRHIKKEQPIEPYHRYAAHEELVRALVMGKPGVYLNTSCEGREWMYLGESVDVAHRNLGHRNGNFFLVRVYVTNTKQDAKNLQDALYRRLDDIDRQQKIIRMKRFPHGDPGCWGAIRLDNGMNAIATIDEIVDTYYKEWCRAKAGVLH